MLDIFIFILLAIFLLFGFIRGFKKELYSVVSLFLFIFISYFYASFIGKYIFNFIDYDLDSFPQYSYLVIGCIIVFILSKFFVSSVGRFIFNSSSLISNVFLDKFFGIFFGFIKGVILLTTVFQIIMYYENFHLITDFDNNSLFLDYFLKFGVQLQHVWNHWYS